MYQTTYCLEEPAMTEARARTMPSDSYGATLTACHDSFSQTYKDNASLKLVLLADVKSGNEYKHRTTAESYELSKLEVWFHIVRNKDRNIAEIAVSMPHAEFFFER